MTEKEHQIDQPPLKTFRMGIVISLRWFTILLLSSLLLGGLYFQLPYKIFIIIALLWASFVLLSGVIRQVVLAIFLLSFVGVVVWLFMPEQSSGWEPFTYADQLKTLEEKRIVEPAQNAALIYRKLLTGFDSNMLEYEIADLDPEGASVLGPWTTEKNPALGKWYDKHRQTLSTLMKATGMERCYFPIPSNFQQFEGHMLQVNHLKSWARILLRDANRDIGEGRFDAGLEKVFALYRLSDHLYQQDTLLHRVTGNVIDITTTTSIRRYVLEQPLDEGHIRLIEGQLVEKYPIEEHWPEISESLEFMVKNLAVCMLYEVDGDGNTRRSHNMARIINSHFQLKISFRNSETFFSKIGLMLHWLSLPESPDKLAEMIESSFKKYEDTTGTSAYKQRNRRLLSSKTRFNASKLADQGADYATGYYYALKTRSQRALQTKRALKLIIALRRFEKVNGYWPSNLKILPDLDPELLVDPLGETPFIYRVKGNTFVLYAVGLNKKDDEGLNIPLTLDKNAPDDIVFWPAEKPKSETE